MTLPTADDVALAIVTAARETGESPVACIRGVMAQRCRHYAMHALQRVFNGLPNDTAALLVGCPGKPRSFYSNSQYQVVRGNKADWWDWKILGRVIAALETALDETGRSATVERESGRANLPAVIEPSQHRPRSSHQRAIDDAKAAVPSTLDKLNTRRRIVPAQDCENVTSELMGDPPPARSALANR